MRKKPTQPNSWPWDWVVPVVGRREQTVDHADDAGAAGLGLLTIHSVAVVGASGASFISRCRRR